MSEVHACFHVNLESTLCDEIGSELFDNLVEKCRTEMGILNKKYALKNPAAFAMILEMATAEGKTAPTVETIVQAIATRATTARANTV